MKIKATLITLALAISTFLFGCGSPADQHGVSINKINLVK